MKKLFVILLFSCVLKTQANPYLKLFFKDTTKIPTSTNSAGGVHINFHDSLLTSLFNRYNVIQFAKEYPSASQFPSSLVPAQKLKLVYRVRLELSNTSLSSLRDSNT